MSYWKLKKSRIPGKVPGLNEVDADTIALNQADGIAFVRKRGLEGEADSIVPLTGSDKYFEYYVNHKLVEVIQHNLGKMPSVSILEADAHACLADVEHLDENCVKISFSDFFSGKITFN